mmetsp:Transcript_14732/g.32826  ORF Transcript_14732/g.32826 Transcript_14732/m.32826 type:complete len:487 (+) Transcript_14732:208-1668(+)
MQNRGINNANPAPEDYSVASPSSHGGMQGEHNALHRTIGNSCGFEMWRENENDGDCMYAGEQEQEEGEEGENGERGALMGSSVGRSRHHVSPSSHSAGSASSKSSAISSGSRIRDAIMISVALIVGGAASARYYGGRGNIASVESLRRSGGRASGSLGGSGSGSGSSQIIEQEPQTQRRSFVCITGQLSRLELDNKIATVLEPLRSIGLDPDIALVIDDSISYTTNDQRIDADYHPRYETFTRAVQDLRNYGYNVVTDEPYHQVPNPIVAPDYVLNLHRRGSFDEIKHMERATNNVRMLESWSQCHAAMSRHVDRMSTYDVVVRVREDVGFLEAIDMDQVVQDLSRDPTALLSNGCRSEYQGTGMNDKFAILSRHAARPYFTLPFHNMYASPIDDRMKNTERYTYWTYTNEGLNVVRYDAIRDVVKLVVNADGETMLFHQERKKLAKQCNVEVLDDSVPGDCVVKWDKRRKEMEVASTVCWKSIKN